jgi:gliding motility-associated-like protein
MRLRLLPVTFILFWSNFFLTKANAQTITVSPVTGIINACAGSPSASPNIQQFTVTGTGLIGAVTIYGPGRFQFSDNPNTGYVHLLSLPANGSTLSKIIYVRVTAQPAGTITDQLTLTSNLASSKTVAVTATINPLPTVNAVPNQTVASGATTTPITFTGTGQVYSWTNDNTNIGLALNGQGDIPAFAAINNTGTEQTATITVIPKPAGFLYVANANSNSVTVINTGNNVPIETIAVGLLPYKVVVNPNGLYAYVINQQSYTVTVIDAITNVVKTTISVGHNPNDMQISPDGKKLYIICGDGSVSTINTLTNTVAATIQLNYGLNSAGISPDGTHLYVYDFLESKLIVIKTLTNTIEAKIAGSQHSYSRVFTADGFLYQAESDATTVRKINTSNYTVVKAISVGIDPIGIVLTPDEKRIFVANSLSKSVSVISTVNDEVIKTIPVSASDGGLAISPDGNFVYTAGLASREVSVISTATNTVVNRISLTEDHGWFALNKDGSRLYICSAGSDVFVINTANNSLITTISTGRNPIIQSNEAISAGNGCDGEPTTFTITVAPSPPTITAIGSISGLSTPYGTPSSSGSFMLSGIGLQNAVTVTPPAGFEVSTDNIAFTPTLNVNNNGATNTTVYVRLAGTANAASYSGNIELSSPGATNVYVSIANSTVNPAPFNITGTWVKTYGDDLAATQTLYYNTPGFTFNNPALKNGNSFNSIDLTFTAGTSLMDAAGVYPGALTISNFTGRNGFLASNYIITYQPIDLVIASAPLTIQADRVTKPFGAVLTPKTGTGYTITGLKNNETVGAATVTYGAGAPASAAVGVYPSSAIINAASGGTFLPANYAITYVPNEVEVLPPPPPLITITGAPQAVNTVYGTPSASSSFIVSATNLATNSITFTAPDGFELSVWATGFSKSVTVGTAGALAPTVINIRLSSTANKGSYTGDITVVASPATNTVTMPLSTVSSAPLTITPNNENKPYGDILIDGAGPVKFAITAGALKNGNTLSGAIYVYGQGKAAMVNVGVYNNAVGITNLAGSDGFLATNYDITYILGNINVLPANLTITASSATKVYGTTLSANPTFTAVGLKNNGTITNANFDYVDGTLATSNVGSYTIIPTNAIGSFTPSNYNIKYLPGTLSVTPAPLTITAGNATRNFGAVNPAFAVTYSGFVNGDNEAQLTKPPIVTSTASISSAAGTYPIIPSGASALNYNITYLSGLLTVNPPTELVIPNTFTPNNDGINDTWKIPALASYPNCMVQVFNRLGTSVYRSAGYPVDWNGTSNGKDLPVGVYYYIIDTKAWGIKTSGTITVIR